MIETIPILGSSSGNTVIQINGQENINLYPKIETAGAKTMIGLYSTPGLKLIQSSGVGGSGRSNGVQWQNKHYFVIGNKLISIDSFDAVTVVGTLNTTSGYCVIAKGRSYLLIVDGTNGYTWDGTTFAQVTDPDFPANPTHAIYVDGYFLVNEANTDNFYRSDFEDPTAWQALIFEVASASPDNILALGAFDRDIYVPGTETVQRYFNNGGIGFNFAPYPKSAQMGLVAPYSFVKSAYGMTGLFNTEDGGLAVATMNGGQISIESDDDNNDEMDSFSVKSDAIGSVHTYDGLTFYSLTFPTANETLVFNLGRGLTHKRSSYLVGRWRVNGIGFNGTKLLAVDYNSDNIYELDQNTYTENGIAIIRDRITQYIHNSKNRFSCARYEVEAQAGVGLISGPGSNPKHGLAISRDGSKRFTGYRYKSIGKIGKYNKRSIWRKLGGDYVQFNTWIRYSEPTPYSIIGGYGKFRF